MVGKGLAKIIPDMCKAARIQGCKTGCSGKVTCPTVLHQLNFSDQLIEDIVFTRNFT